MEEKAIKKTGKKENIETAEKKARHKKIKTKTLILSFLIFSFSYFSLVGGLIYGLGLQNYFTRQNERLFPYPAALAGKSWIRMSAVNERLKAVQNFYENQDFSEIGFRVDFNTPEGKKRLLIKEKDVLNKMIENELIEQAANERGIAMSDDMIGKEVEKKLKESGDAKQLTSNLEKLYGWTTEDFKKNIVKPDMYKKALQLKILEEDADISKAKNKIKQAKAELDSRISFEEVVKKYSEGESARNNGELGWFGFDQMLPELARISASLKKGETSDITASSIGLHIIEVTDSKEEDGKQMVKVRQIFVRTKSFSEWLAEEEKSKSITIFLKDYKWNKDSSKLEFRNQDLTNFEKNLEINSPGDISVMF